MGAIVNRLDLLPVNAGKGLESRLARVGTTPLTGTLVLFCSDHELAESGVIKSVSEVIYTRTFVQASSMLAVSGANMTASVKDLWNVIFKSDGNVLQ
jgi:hypothetical protein